jgi:transcriptional regulator GlxA family with amidase domain
LFLLSHLQTRDTVDECNASPNLAARKLQEVDAFMREHMIQSVTLIELTTASSVSVRSLNNLCGLEYCQSPMERLRNLRLEAARERLLSNNQVSVTQVSLDYGFSHMGRFASYYRQRFGELPRITAMA